MRALPRPTSCRRLPVVREVVEVEHKRSPSGAGTSLIALRFGSGLPYDAKAHHLSLVSVVGKASHCVIAA